MFLQLEIVGKFAWILFEMDNNELFPLLESNDSFPAKVQELVQVQAVTSIYLSWKLSGSKECSQLIDLQFKQHFLQYFHSGIFNRHKWSKQTNNTFIFYSTFILEFLIDIFLFAQIQDMSYGKRNRFCTINYAVKAISQFFINILK